ncbi:putative cyclin-B3-1 [Bidens hawaiensis]|uniref:putative cyclin-B3-1 n=1 Tax=Bidens hawaiensis TaxID=980011 RepID=UPI0040492DD2
MSKSSIYLLLCSDIYKNPYQPTVKTTVGIPKAQRVSRTTSVFTKSTSATSVLSKKTVEPSKSESVSCKKSAQDVTFDASTSKLTVKGKSGAGRRKSYTSLLIERTELLKDQASATKEEILPKIYDDANQLDVAEYIDEIYQHYWVTEASNQPLKNYMDIQREITPQMRGILINWLIEVHLKYDLMQETLYLMVTLFDFYLSAVKIKKSEMQLVGLTSLLLASKYEDFWHPQVMELISISAETYTREQMLGMETTILQTLNFRLHLPTPYVFMLRFLRAAQGGKKFENLAYFLIELCLVEYDALHYKPSLLCASAIYVARCTLQLTPAWTPLLCKHSKYHEFQIRDCADMILGFHQAASKSVLRVTYDKYTRGENCKVALIKPLVKLPPP